jgi:small subunit ribosomal protein S3Ae
MAVGKNKKLGKKRKGGARKQADPFVKKEWYDVRAPSVFPTRALGHTVVTKTQGNRIAKDSLLGRVFEVSLGDLKKDSEDDAFRKFRFRGEDVSGSQLLTSFYGMGLTTDKLRSLVRKWHSLIEANTEVKTADGYTLRIFCIGFTKRRPNQTRKTSYAQSAQVRAIRAKMVQIIQKEASTADLNELVAKLIPESIGGQIEKATQGIYPLQNVLIRKVKVLKSPKLDVGRLLDSHGGADAVRAADSGNIVVEREETAADKKKAKKAVKKTAKKEAAKDD